MQHEPWELKMAESQKRFIAQVMRAAAKWKTAEVDDHAAGKWAQHAIILVTLDHTIEFVGDLERYVPGKKRTKGPLAAPLIMLRDALAALREGKIDPLLQPGPAGPTLSPNASKAFPLTAPMTELLNQLAALKQGTTGPLLVPAL